MAGTIIEILPKTSYTFNGTTTLEIGPRFINTVDWRSASLAVQVFATGGPSTNTIAVSVFNAYNSPDDPNTVFKSSSSLASASFAIGAVPNPAVVVNAGISSGIGPMLKAELTATLGIVSVTTCTISVVLVGRSD